MNIKERISALRKEMKAKKIDCYYVPTDDDHMSEYIGEHFMARKYIGGFTGSAGWVVVTQKEAGLWTDGRYFVQAAKQLKGTGIKLFKMGQEGVPTTFDYIIANTPKKGTLGFDGKVVNTYMAKSLASALKAKQARVKLDEDLVGNIWEDRPAMPKDKIFILSDKYTGESRVKKIARVKAQMKEAKCNVMVVTSLEDVCWLLNIRGNDVANTPVTYGYVVINDRSTILYIDPEKVDKKVKATLAKDKISIKPYDAIAKDIKSLKNKCVWIDTTKLNAYIYENLDKSNRVYDKTCPCVLYRAIKNKVEIENTKNTHIKDGVAMVKFIYWLKSNIGKEKISEMSASEVLYSARAAQKEYIEPSFNTIAAYKANAAMMHYSATKDSDTELSTNGFLLVDSGGTYYGGTTDITRTISLGKPSAEEKLYYTTVVRSNLNLSMAKFLHGSSGINLDILARGVVWQLDIDYQCGTGHGVGHVLSVHEGPQSFYWGQPRQGRYPAVLEEGMIITDEPGIYTPGKIGIRIENELLVVKGKKNDYGQFMQFEPITYCPIDLDAIDASLMTDSEIKYLNDYHALVFKKLSPFLNNEEKAWLKEQTRQVTR